MKGWGSPSIQESRWVIEESYDYSLNCGTRFKNKPDSGIGTMIILPIMKTIDKCMQHNHTGNIN